MHINQWMLAKSSINGEFVIQQTLVKCGRKMIPMIYHRTKLSRSRQWPNVANTIMPLLEDFVSLQTLTKCGPKCAPHNGTLSRSGLQPNVVQIVPLIGGLCHATDFDLIWPKMCPSLEDFVMKWTSTKCGLILWPNVAQNVPPIGGLCHAVDFNQMWPVMCPLLEDFVTQRTLTKCGPDMCLLMGGFVLLQGLTRFGPIMCSSSKKASNKETDSYCWSMQK